MSQRQTDWVKIVSICGVISFFGTLFLLLGNEFSVYKPLPATVADHEMRLRTLENYTETNTIMFANQFNVVNSRLQWIQNHLGSEDDKSPRSRGEESAYVTPTNKIAVDP